MKVSPGPSRPISPLRRAAVAVAAAGSALALVAGCTGTSGPSGTAGPVGRAGGGAFTADPAAALQPFASCDQLLDYVRSEAKPLVGPYGLAGGPVAYNAGMAVEGATPSAGATGAAAGSGSSADQARSGTNNQEDGVDEADTVKTDGTIIVTSLNGRIQVTDADAGRLLSTITIPRAGSVSAELLLSGRTLIVLSTSTDAYPTLSDGPERLTVPAFAPQRTTVTRVDLTDPSAPKVLGASRIEGGYRSARMIGTSVRLVLVSEPTGLRFTQPKSGGLDAEEDATRANKDVIAKSTIDDWVPHVQTLDAEGNASKAQRLIDCAAIARPDEFAGLSTLSVLTFDAGSADGRVTPTSTVGVVATGETVYASTDRLIVATSPWDIWNLGWLRRSDMSKLKTGLHSFDISDPATTRYAGSGKVAGRLVNQFALDEDGGVIRVATTTSDLQWSTDTQSSLLVLKEQGDKLVTVGRVDGMGLTEHIRSVRYLSPTLAAVVTFRQTDPLYLVDTSDPTKPKVAGELKIPGYSAYLHPVGDGLLLGVGQDADAETGAVRGLQVSLFDVGDAARPTRLQQLTWKNANSPVEWDHRAFLWWKDTAYVPATLWSNSRDFTGVLTARLAGRSLADGPRAASSRSGYDDSPSRVFVIGDNLWTLGYRGLQRFDLATLTPEKTIPLPS